jgi:hypothetical protein
MVWQHIVHKHFVKVVWQHIVHKHHFNDVYY